MSRREMLETLDGPLRTHRADRRESRRRRRIASRCPTARSSASSPRRPTPFCGSCDRSRLTADGMWYLCLYAARGIDLRAALRRGATTDELAALITGPVARRATTAAPRIGSRSASGGRSSPSRTCARIRTSRCIRGADVSSDRLQSRALSPRAARRDLKRLVQEPDVAVVQFRRRHPGVSRDEQHAQRRTDGDQTLRERRPSHQRHHDIGHQQIDLVAVPIEDLARRDRRRRFRSRCNPAAAARRR